MLDYRTDFFFKIVKSTLGYTPAIEIKPAHLANGLFRAVCGGYVNNEAQHWAIYPKGYPKLTLDPNDPYQRKRQTQFEGFTSQQQAALQFLDGKEKEREMLYSLLAADKTIFSSVGTSSYTLSNSGHVTNDNHDRDAGIWLYHILKQGERCPALDLLEQLLRQEPRHRTDELSTLTLPLDNVQALLKSYKQQEYKDWAPNSLAIDDTGQFLDPIVHTIRKAFDQLAQSDAEIAKRNGKLDTLRRFTILACFSVYLHLINSGRSDLNKPIPMLLRFDKSASTLYEASINSYQWGLRSIDEFLRREITNFVEQLVKEGKYGTWADSDIEKHIRETINWYKVKSDQGKVDKEIQVAKFKDDCWRFYCSYRGEITNYSSVEAFAHAATDMLGLVLSSKPQDVARALGTRIGLLGQSEGQNKKSYTPQPDFLEVLVRATIPLGTIWTLVEIAEYWANHYGILFGALGDDNDRLQEEWGVTPVDRDELASNVNALADLLEMSGYARRYADGVVLVTVGN